MDEKEMEELYIKSLKSYDTYLEELRECREEDKKHHEEIVKLLREIADNTRSTTNVIKG